MGRWTALSPPRESVTTPGMTHDLFPGPSFVISRATLQPLLLLLLLHALHRLHWRIGLHIGGSRPHFVSPHHHCHPESQHCSDPQMMMCSQCQQGHHVPVIVGWGDERTVGEEEEEEEEGDERRFGVGWQVQSY